ncbi:hypothetical protein BJ508DRAFT_379929 [Ascobolus immersus RN42]|uniref:Uncharacterized protein n=1 Tax=Ascobolus immersus RN42 TaxID=1160509 RepID=A0A3N4HP32_ASCIM|nr:hypothetical protein BJ508DRAFT_379929 [Ascobolus immersus RN42]
MMDFLLSVNTQVKIDYQLELKDGIAQTDSSIGISTRSRDNRTTQKGNRQRELETPAKHVVALINSHASYRNTMNFGVEDGYFRSTMLHTGGHQRTAGLEGQSPGAASVLLPVRDSASVSVLFGFSLNSFGFPTELPSLPLRLLKANRVWPSIDPYDIGFTVLRL